MIAEFSRHQNVLVKTADYTLVKSDSGSLVTNRGASGTVNITLPIDAEVGDHFTFRVGTAQILNVKHGQTTNLFVVNGAVQTANHDISADDEGEEMRATKVTSTDWLCSVIGTWTVS